MGGVYVLADLGTDLQGLRDRHNGLVKRDSGAASFGRQVLWTDFDGAIPSVNGSGAVTGAYTHVIRSTATGGRHRATLLSATAASATPTVANSVELVQDAGLFLGASRVLRIYAADATDYAALASGANGMLVLGGSGTDAGYFNVVGLIAATIGPDADSQHTLPNVTADTVTLNGAIQTLLFKTLTNPTINAATLSGTLAGAPDFSGAVTFSGLTWTTFAPSVTQSAALAMTVNWARYRVIGKLAIVQIKMTYSSGAAVATNAITITGIPTAIQPVRVGAYAVAGTMVFFDSSANTPYVGFAETTTTTTVIGYRDGAAAVGAFGVDPNVAMAAGDVVACQLAYEIA